MNTITVADQHRNTPRRAPAALRKLTPRDRQRVLDRLRDLDELATLVRERPFSGRWAA